MTPDPRTILGVDADATANDIRRAYRRLAAEWHPDVNIDPGAGDRFREIKTAHDTLITPTGRTPGTRKPRRERAPRGLGQVFKRRAFYWVCITHNGVRLRESSRSESKNIAIQLLKDCHTAIRAGTFTTIAAVRDNIRATSGITIGNLRDAVIEDAKRNGRRSVKRKEQAYKSIIRHMGEDTPMDAIDKARIDDYIRARGRDPIGSARRRDKKTGKLRCKRTVSNGTINRELDQLALGFGLVDRTPPRYKRLRESAPRDRWPTSDELDRVIGHMPDHLRPVMTLLRMTGWRVREALRLEWRRVEMDAGTIRLEHRDTKSGKPRLYPFREFPALAALIEERRRATDTWQRDHGTVIRHVFWRPGTDATGRDVAVPVTSWTKWWRRACKRANVADLTPHDMRRGAARDLIRSGVDETVAMKLLGHSTASTFRRYNITADDDLRDAVRRRAATYAHADRAAAK